MGKKDLISRREHTVEQTRTSSATVGAVKGGRALQLEQSMGSSAAVRAVKGGRVLKLEQSRGASAAVRAVKGPSATGRAV